jgi:hypothetical protein
MNKEQQELLDEVYENYSKEYEKDNSIGMCLLVARIDGKSTYRKPNKEMFIGLCTFDTEFSEKWGLKIEERELSLEERQNLYFKLNPEFRLVHEDMDKHMDKHNIPTKLITITYNDVFVALGLQNKTIESYE